jgi:hypothetical protein
MDMDKFPTCGLIATQRFAKGGNLCLSTGLDFPALSTTWNSVSVSKLSQGGLMMYDQASTNYLDCNLERSRRSQPTCILKPNNKKFPALA